jgi:hypothetical protein
MFGVYRLGPLNTIARELAKFRPKLKSVGVQGVRGNRVSSEPADDYTFSVEMGRTHRVRIGLFVHMVIRLAVKRAEFVGDRMSYITLRCH